MIKYRNFITHARHFKQVPRPALCPQWRVTLTHFSDAAIHLLKMLTDHFIGNNRHYQAVSILVKNSENDGAMALPLSLWMHATKTNSGT
jgi:hypothetical protein